MRFLMSDAQRFATAVLCLIDEGMLVRGGNFTVEGLVKMLEHGTTYRAKRKRGRQPYELEAMILDMLAPSDLRYRRSVNALIESLPVARWMGEPLIPPPELVAQDATTRREAIAQRIPAEQFEKGWDKVPEMLLPSHLRLLDAPVTPRRRDQGAVVEALPPASPAPGVAAPPSADTD